eukprot:14521117-Alexandrium_andersonii.AAC.1
MVEAEDRLLGQVGARCFHRPSFPSVVSLQQARLVRVGLGGPHGQRGRRASARGKQQAPQDPHEEP